MNSPESASGVLRLCMTPAEAAALAAHPLVRALGVGRPRSQLLRTVYYDGPALELARSGWCLGVRHAGSSRVQFVRERNARRDAPAPRGAEVRLAGEAPDLALVTELELRHALERELADTSLEPAFEIEVRRTQRRLAEDETELSWSLDVGEIRAGRQRLPLAELRLEVLRGEPGYPQLLALELSEGIGLRLATQSPVERGLAALTGERPSASKAGRIRLPTEASVEAVIEALVASGARQILANEIPAHEGDDPEGVHQMRVGARRLRAALALFGRMLPDRTTTSLKTELRWLGGELAPARDLDVFLGELLEPLARRLPDHPGLKRLRDAALELRAESYSRVRRALDSKRYTRLLLGLGRWRARRAWREQPLSERSARLFAPAEQQVAGLLARRHRKALRLGRDVARRPVAEQHLLRIHVKKVRYASEAVRSLFPRKKAARYIEHLADLQEVLGHLNDVAAAERVLDDLLARLGTEATARHHRAAGFVAGWAARTAERRLRRLEKLWKVFEKTEPFWDL